MWKIVGQQYNRKTHDTPRTRPQASVKWFPPELWCIIFWLVLPADGVTHITANTSDKNIILTLIHSSAYWRAIIESVPRFWASIQVTVPVVISVKRAKKIEKLVRLWVVNSSTCDLSLHYTLLEKGGPRGRVKEKALCSILSALFVGHDRWRHLRIDLACVTSFKFIHDSSLWRPKVELPRLQSLTLTIASSGSRHEIVTSPQFKITPLLGIASAPLIHYLSLIDLPLDIFGYVFPWSQLESLELVGHNQRLSTVEWLLIMCECDALKICHVSIFSAILNLHHGTTLVPNLEYLHITSCETSLSHIYQSLCCPKLKTLLLEYDRQWEIELEEDPEVFLMFIDRIPGLLALSVCNVPIPGHALTTSLGRLDRLIALCVQEQHDTNEVLHELAVPNHLVPRLKYVRFDSEDIMADILLRFMECRRESTTREQLESCYVQRGDSDIAIQIGMDVWASLDTIIALVS